jgi:hypothetical protein
MPGNKPQAGEIWITSGNFMVFVDGIKIRHNKTYDRHDVRCQVSVLDDVFRKSIMLTGDFPQEGFIRRIEEAV